MIKTWKDLSDEHITFLLNNYKIKNLRRISRELGVSCNILYAWLEHNNLNDVKFQTHIKEDEIQFIINNYTKLTSQEISKHLGRHVSTINRIIREQCNIENTKRRSKKLSEEELLFIKNNYRQFTAVEIGKKLNRNSGTIHSAIKRLTHIKKDKNIFSQSDIKILRERYSYNSNKELAVILNKTTEEIARMAYKLGLFKTKEIKVGSKNNNWTVIEIIHIKQKYLYRCKCICENIVDIRKESFLKSKGCGCQTKNSKNKYELYFKSIIRGAKSRGLELNISTKDIELLIKQQNFICAISGQKIQLDKHANLTTASLDRIDSSKGYIKENIQWIHKDINKMKWNFNQEYFIEICNKISNFQKKNNNESN